MSYKNMVFATVVVVITWNTKDIPTDDNGMLVVILTGVSNMLFGDSYTPKTAQRGLGIS